MINTHKRNVGILSGRTDKNNEVKISLNKISDNELEVLYLARKGLTSVQMADKMCKGVRTIEGYKASIMKKFKAKSFTQACIFYFE